MTKYLFIGRGSGQEGIWLGDKQVVSFLRKKDIFLEYIRKYLSATILLDIYIDELDRVICLEYQKWGQKNTIAIFYMGRKLYFAHHYYDEKKQAMCVFKSWSQEKLYAEKFEIDVFDEVGRTKQDGSSGKNVLPIAVLLEKEEKKADKQSIISKKEKFLRRKIKNIESDLDKVSQKNKIIELIETCDDLSKLEKKIKIGDIPMKFKEASHYLRRDELYQKHKNLKKAEGILTSRLEGTVEELKGKNFKKQERSSLDVVKPVWKTTKNNENQKKNLGNIEIFKVNGIDLGVGINAQGNDRLRKEWAKKVDYWFHLDGDKSPHIIIKLNDRIMDDEVLKTVASAMLRFSNFNTSEIQLIYTQVKNLKGIKGVAGSVNYKKEKHIKVYEIPNWDDLINS